MKPSTSDESRLGRSLALPLAVALGSAVCAAQEPVRAGDRVRDRAARETPVVRVFRDSKSAVVNLSTTKIVRLRSPFGIGGILDEIFDFPSLERQFEQHSVGSGFLIHPAGYLLTNAHVVDRATECKVTFADQTELPAEPVAIDRKHDIAVLKVQADRPLPALKLGRSGDLMPGETVIAIGNPLGYQHTVTSGIISALDRELRFGPDLVYEGLIQTDASINPGNSGGPLLNVVGELIGVNTAIRGDAQNVSFAIPIDRVRSILPAVLDIERRRRIDLGITFDGSPGGSNGDEGVRVSTVLADSPAAQAGVRRGDLVTKIGAHATPEFIDAFAALDEAPLDKALTFELARRGGSPLTVEITLRQLSRPDPTRTLLARFGIAARELGRDDLQRLGLRRPLGLLVTKVEARSEAAANVREGDVITQVGGWPVNSLATLAYLLQQVAPGDRVAMGLLRIMPDSFLRTEIVLVAR